MRNNTIIETELTVTDLTSQCLGVSTWEEKQVLTPRVLPQEKVRVRLFPSKTGWRGEVVELLETSPWRIAESCPLSGECGGCDFDHVSPEVAFSWKVRAKLGQLGQDLTLPINEVKSPHTFGYRGRVIFHFGRGADGRLDLGFFDKRRALVAPQECGLLMKELNVALALIRSNWLPKLNSTEAATLFSLDLSLTSNILSGKVAANLAISPSAAGRQALKGRGKNKLLAKLNESLKLTLAEANLLENYPVGPVVSSWPELALDLCAGPGGFSQINPEVNKLLVGKILAWSKDFSGSGGRVLDLYSGLGNIALPLAQSGFNVTAVESDPLSLVAARHNGRKVPNFRLLEGYAKDVTSTLVRNGERFELIVLDPPRRGAEELLSSLAALSPTAIIYVACEPKVLASDLPALASLGYRPLELVAFDMFPQTSHLEVVALLGR